MDLVTYPSESDILETYENSKHGVKYFLDFLYSWNKRNIKVYTDDFWMSQNNLGVDYWFQTKLCTNRRSYNTYILTHRKHIRIVQQGTVKKWYKRKNEINVRDL